jgi:hypothetical protein
MMICLPALIHGRPEKSALLETAGDAGEGNTAVAKPGSDIARTIGQQRSGQAGHAEKGDFPQISVPQFENAGGGIKSPNTFSNCALGLKRP